MSTMIDSGLSAATTAINARWREGLPIWWAIQDDVLAARGEQTLSELVRESYLRVDALMSRLPGSDR